ncbi:isoprenyl transferase [Paludibacter sp. 221]|uniref:isoprenyl transferase n=1 Tax=Paludibacter sp. 221 TaxID=2302939 RepID=UPI0013D7F989|nr:isoprenyl transferase [Paludibacter sp. 221]NDV47220.1 isoprenyl transferase [Paludibacter sp. 221]
MTYKEKIDKARLPQHIAIIMDGNGRWAKERGFDRIVGHQNGVVSVRETTEAAAEIGIKYLTLYAFSTENWGRKKEEVDALMELLVDTIEKETPTLNKNNVRLLTIGDLKRLPEGAAKKMAKCLDDTAGNTGLSLVLALSYSSRWEITNAVKEICEEVKDGKLNPDDITADVISRHLDTKSIPDPDLLIRTSGELRISNFLLWQLAYTELYFTDVNWPDFRKENLYEAIYNFQQRERRFGK